MVVCVVLAENLAGLLGKVPDQLPEASHDAFAASANPFSDAAFLVGPSQ
jgi:hypothetical protein